MQRHYELLLKATEKKAKRALRFQIKDKKSVKYGGFPDEYNIIQPKFAIYKVVNMASVYMNPDSGLYKNEELLEGIRAGLDYIKREQRPDGTFDLVDCNFFSGPDTSFCVKRLLLFYKYVLRNPEAPGAKEFAGILKEIVYAGGKGMAAGGFHTPNHRWAVASNLLECWNLFGDDVFKLRADKYLAEGIDCTEDGEYSERSAGNYNRINNDAVITMGEILGDEKYIDCAEKNLMMMLNYLEPDDTIFTNNSTRQDRGVKVYPKEYYFEYLYIGYKRHNEKLLSMANFIMEQCAERNSFPDHLIYMMLHPELVKFEYDGCGYATDYEAHYADSGILRRRKNNLSYTILNNSSNFLWFQNGDLSLGMKLGISFFEHRTFKSETLEKAGEAYALHQSMKGWYYLPFGEFRGTSDWWKMDNEHTRDRIKGVDFDIDVTVKEIEDGVQIRLKGTGVDRIPVRLELAFDSGTWVNGDCFAAEGKAGEYVIAKAGMVTASKGAYAIEVGPAFYDHDFVVGKVGSEPRSAQCYTVYFTDTAEFDRTLTVKAKDGVVY